MKTPQLVASLCWLIARQCWAFRGPLWLLVLGLLPCSVAKATNVYVAGTYTTVEWPWYSTALTHLATYPFSGLIFDHVDSHGNINTRLVNASWGDESGIPLQGDGRYAGFTGALHLNVGYYLAPNDPVIVTVLTVHFTDGLMDGAWPGDGIEGAPGQAGRLSIDKIRIYDPDRLEALGDPVQTATGACTDHRSLFHFTGARDWNFDLEYHSVFANAQNVEGALSVGWTHNFETKITPDGANLVVQWNAIRASTFVPAPEQPGRYLCPDDAARYDGLTARPEGGWLLTRRDQSTQRFDASGQLVEDRDPHGHVLVLTYDHSHLARIVDPLSNTSLSLGYSGNRLAKLTDGTGAVVNFEYQIMPGYYQILSRIVDQNGHQTTFTYNQGNRALLTVRDHLGTLLVANTYDALDRVGAQADGVGGSQPMTFAYAEHGLPRNTLFAPSDAEHRTPLILPDPTHLHVETFTSFDGRTLNNTFDAAGRLARVSVDENVTTLGYDAQGNVASITDPSGIVSPVDPHSTVTVTDHDGRQSIHRFDPAYNLCSLTNPLGHTTHYTYDIVGNVTSVSDALGRTARFSYDTAGNVLTTTDSAGLVTHHTYDGRNNLLTITDPLGQVTTRTYDASNNVLSLTDANGAVTAWSYDANGLPLTMTLPRGGIYRYSYAAGRLAQVTDPAGVITKFGYDADGRELYREDGLGHRATSTYDPAGNLLTTTDALQQRTSYTYDHRNRVRTITDPSGAVTSCEYDANGNRLKTTDALGHVTSNAYDGAGRLVALTDALGRVTRQRYDAAAQLVATTDPAGHVTGQDYDAAAQQIAVIDAAGRRTAHDFDERGLLVRTTDPLGRVTTYARDELGRGTITEDPLGRKSSVAHDPAGRMVQLSDPGNLVVAQEFDPDGNRTGLVNPALARTAFAYDGAGRLTEATTPEGRTTRTTYDTRGWRETEVEPSGQITRFSYDDAGCIRQVSDEAGTISFARDACGRPLTVTEGTRVLTRAYDALGRLTRFTDADGNAIGYDYDGIGRLVCLVYPDGKTVAYHYDMAGRIDAVTDWAGRVTAYTYDAVGRMTGMTRPNGTKQARVYDEAGQLSRCIDYAPDGVTVIASGEYDYDAGGQLTAETSVPAIGPVLTSTKQTFDRDNRVLTHNGSALVFDADGNLLSIESGVEPSRLVYDARNRLTQAGEVSYEYDAENHRVGVSDARGTARFAINPNAPLDQALVRTAVDGTKTLYVYGLGLLYEDTGSAVRYYHADRRGDIVALTDAAGTVTDRMGYGPYGESVLRTGASETPFRFGGSWGVQTDANGLTYHRARYYHPQLRRFLNQDTVLGDSAKAGSLNRYAYTSGNPLMAIDPAGRFERDVHEGNPKQDYGTYTWAKQAGFPGWMAARIGAADIGVDHVSETNFIALPWDPSLSGRSRHFKIPMESDIDSRDMWGELEMQNALTSWQAGDWNGALDALGRGLHSIQDSYSHGDFDNEAMPYVWHYDFARGWWGGDMDNWSLRGNIHPQVSENTQSYLRRFIDAIRELKKRCAQK